MKDKAQSRKSLADDFAYSAFLGGSLCGQLPSPQLIGCKLQSGHLAGHV